MNMQTIDGTAIFDHVTAMRTIVNAIKDDDLNLKYGGSIEWEDKFKFDKYLVQYSIDDLAEEAFLFTRNDLEGAVHMIAEFVVHSLKPFETRGLSRILHDLSNIHLIELDRYVRFSHNLPAATIQEQMPTERPKRLGCSRNGVIPMNWTITIG